MDSYATPNLIVPENKITSSIAPDGTCATYSIGNEDHTLGNAVRHLLARNRDVELVGYSIPHPSEAKLNLRVQTRGGKHAHEAVKDALIDLIDLCEHVKYVYQEAVEQSGAMEQ